MTLLINIYKQALKLLPIGYRDQYAEPMIQTLADMLDDQKTVIAKWCVWLRTMYNVPSTTASQYVQLGGATMNKMPNYAKQGTLVSSTLLLPFIVLVTLNSIHPLSSAWRSIGYIGIFILPAIALVLEGVIFGRLFVSHDLGSRLKSIKQLQSNWILFAVPLLAFVMTAFAFGHDSVHCATSSPSRIAQCARNS